MTNSGAALAPRSNGKDRALSAERVIVAFVCENCGRPGIAPSSGIRRRPVLPDFAWPFAVHEVAVPCSGRVQPEHFLKALEDGADAVAVICCEEGNCHHLEGNRRCERRLGYVNSLVQEAGLGGDRLAIFHLPGSAKQDMALGTGTTPMTDLAMPAKIAAVRDAFVARVATISRNPLAKGDLPDESPYEVDSEDESD